MLVDVPRMFGASLARAGSSLTAHGIDDGRLEAHGFGPSKPLESNATDPGRQKNRRVEFHITQQGAPSSSGAARPAEVTPPAP